MNVAHGNYNNGRILLQIEKKKKKKITQSLDLCINYEFKNEDWRKEVDYADEYANDFQIIH